MASPPPTPLDPLDPLAAFVGPRAVFVGFQFQPTDDELIVLLNQKIFQLPLYVDIIPTVPHLFTLNPEEIPVSECKYSVVGQEELSVVRHWFFFTTKPEGQLLTKDGYWHATGSPTDIEDPNGRVVGFSHEIDFYHGISPNGVKSNWTIRECQLNPDMLDAATIDDDKTKDMVKNSVVCRVICREDYDVFDVA